MIAWVCAAILAAVCVVAYFLAISARRSREEMDAKCAAFEEALREARIAAERADAAFAALLETVQDGVLILDEDLTVQAANRLAVRYLNLAAEQPVGRPLPSLAADADIVATIRKGIAGDPVRDIPVRRLCPGSGSVALTVRPAGPSRWLVVARDLTERERTDALRRDFVANVSHELRTPMASIRAMAETLRDGAFEDQAVANRFLDTILAEAERLTRIADDLLTLADAETKPPDLKRVNLTDICTDVLSKLRPQAARHKLTLTEHLDPNVVVMGDRDQLEQVVVNLVDNAVKYTQPGGSIQVQLETEGPLAVLRVADTGIGIMAEHLPRIFERFYRVDKARSRQSGGTGLGLSIVKHIVESHGGSVQVESVYTQGSTFTVRLPLAVGTSESEIQTVAVQQI